MSQACTPSHYDRARAAALLDKSASDPAGPAGLAALTLAVAGMGRAALSLAIGVNRPAETGEYFTGRPCPALE